MRYRILSFICALLFSAPAYSITLTMDNAPTFVGITTSSFSQFGYDISGGVFAAGGNGSAHVDGCCGPYPGEVTISRSDGGSFYAKSVDIPWFDNGVLNVPSLTPYNFAYIGVRGVSGGSTFNHLINPGPNGGPGFTYNLPAAFSGGAGLTSLSVYYAAPVGVAGIDPLAGDSHFGVDNIVVAAVPIPAGLALMLPALLGLVAVGRRRRTAAA